MAAKKKHENFIRTEKTNFIFFYVDIIETMSFQFQQYITMPRCLNPSKSTRNHQKVNFRSFTIGNPYSQNVHISLDLHVVPSIPGPTVTGKIASQSPQNELVKPAAKRPKI